MIAPSPALPIRSPPLPKKPPVRDYLSYSSINTYRQCSLRYDFKYVLGLPETGTSTSLAFGSAMHRAVEAHYHEILAGNNHPPIDALFAEFDAEWRLQVELSPQLQAENFEPLKALAERMLKVFQESPAAKPTGHLLAIEEELRGPVIEGCPDVLARIDLVLDDGNELILRDLKTSRSHWSEFQAEDQADQLLLYAPLVQPFAPNKPLRLEFLVLTKTKEPSLELHAVTATPEAIHRTQSMVRQVWRAIEAGHFYPNPGPTHCSTCSFRRDCRQWSG